MISRISGSIEKASLRAGFFMHYPEPVCVVDYRNYGRGVIKQYEIIWWSE